MIPLFPKFKNLELSDSVDVFPYIQKYQPYSDFNFTSMWMWNTKDEIKLSVLNDNLIVIFSDYETNEKFFSLIGNSKLSATVRAVMDFANEQGYPSELRLVPESVAFAIDASMVNLREDKDNHDYIFGTESLASLKGKDYLTKRNMISKFIRRNQNYKFSMLDLSSEEVHMQIVTLVDLWVRNKSEKTNPDVINTNELTALSRLLAVSGSNKNMLACGVYVDGALKAFSIFEKTQHDMVTTHICKADTEITGVCDYMMHKKADFLKKNGIAHINFEQDLGKIGLRSAKQSYRPVTYLKKFTVTGKSC